MEMHMRIRWNVLFFLPLLIILASSEAMAHKDR